MRNQKAETGNHKNIGSCAASLLVVCVCFSASLFAQPVPRPEIDSISPTMGPISGGTVVTILGRNFDARIECILPCPTEVLFDGVPGTLVGDYTDTRIDVRTSVRATPGLVPVTVRRPDGEQTGTAFLYITTLADLYQKVLLPIYTSSIPGAAGSIWETRLVAHNGSHQPVSLAHRNCPPPALCPAVYPLTYTLLPGETLIDPDLVRRGPDEPPGRLIYVSRSEASLVSLTLRVNELSRQATSFGTEIPVIRENEFLSTPAMLLDVTTDPRFRRALRIYEVAVLGPVDFEVNVFSLSKMTPLLRTVITTHTQNTDPILPQDPGFAQILNFLESAPELAGIERVRVEVRPVRTDARFWAFIAVTNNETLQVTTVTPQ